MSCSSLSIRHSEYHGINISFKGKKKWKKNEKSVSFGSLNLNEFFKEAKLDETANHYIFNSSMTCSSTSIKQTKNLKVKKH